MEKKFKIKSDLEFYCYLKANLPIEYKIVSEPKRSYFAEWDYSYKIFYKGKLFKEYVGNFKDIDKGYLIKEAKQILKELEVVRAHRRKQTPPSHRQNFL